MTIFSVGLAAMLVAAGSAAYMDVRTRRIPNALTATLAGVALLVHVADGPLALAGAVGVMICVFLAGTAAFSLGWMGGGDVKLLAACSGIAAFPQCISLLLFVFVAGGAVSLVEALRRRRLRAVVAGTMMMAIGGAPTERFGVPYGVAIALGSGVYVLSVTVAPFLRLPL